MRVIVGFVSLLASVVTILPAAGYAKLCGDDVDGSRVPCACGDTVVSDLTLSDDPVTTTPCAGDGLVIRAAAADHGVTIDLAGKTLQGTGSGFGLWFVYGGPGGARLLSSGGRATLVGFTDGIIAHGIDSVASIDNVLLRKPKRDGVHVAARNYQIHAVEVQDAGRDAVVAGGRGFDIRATRVSNSRRFGFLISGLGGTIGGLGEGDESQGSGRIGFDVTGTGHQLVDCRASLADEDGVHISGMYHFVSGCVAEDNHGDGITGTGMNWLLTGNQALHNSGSGLVVRGMGVQDNGANLGADNGGDAPAGLPITQCSINGVPCAP